MMNIEPLLPYIIGIVLIVGLTTIIMKFWTERFNDDMG